MPGGNSLNTAMKCTGVVAVALIVLSIVLQAKNQPSKPEPSPSTVSTSAAFMPATSSDQAQSSVAATAVSSSDHLQSPAADSPSITADDVESQGGVRAGISSDQPRSMPANRQSPRPAPNDGQMKKLMGELLAHRGDQRAESKVEFKIGSLCCLHGDFETATQHLQRSLQYARNAKLSKTEQNNISCVFAYALAAGNHMTVAERNVPNVVLGETVDAQYRSMLNDLYLRFRAQSAREGDEQQANVWNLCYSSNGGNAVIPAGTAEQVLQKAIEE